MRVLCDDFQLRDRARLEWVPDRCGQFRDPHVVASGDAIHVVVSEQRECRDRASNVYAAPVTVVDGRLETSLAVARLPDARMTAGGAEGRLAICRDLALTTLDAAEAIVVEDVPVFDTPVSVPGCPMDLRCSGIAGTRGQWLFGLAGFECDVTYAQVVLTREDGSDPRELLHTYESVASVTADGDGFAWVSRPRGTRPTSTLWRWRDGALRETTLSVAGTDAVLVEGAAPGQLRILYGRMDPDGRVRLELLVIGDDDALLERHELDAFPDPQPGFDGPQLAATATRFGLVVTSTLAWAGDAIRGALSVVAIDDAGQPIGPPFVHTHELGAEGTASVAVLSDDVVVHHAVTNRETTEALLFGCP
ncbi:MAG: hypothetical protein H6719_25595 [Sandaracinaceae bacterium]|nr:hypothetical protein [Sandaracinaceae bacterium]